MPILSPPVTHHLEVSSPINSEIIFCYSLSRGETGTLKLFDATGRMVESLSVRGKGEVKVEALSPGVYFARLEVAGGADVTRKVVVVR